MDLAEAMAVAMTAAYGSSFSYSAVAEILLAEIHMAVTAVAAAAILAANLCTRRFGFCWGAAFSCFHSGPATL